MPVNLDSIQSSLRQSGYHLDGWLSTPSEVDVLVGTVSANAAEPAFKIAYTLDSGSEADVLTNMEVLIYSSGGVFKGRVRVAPDSSGNTLSSTNLPINEISAGRIKIVSGDVIHVVRSWRLRDLLVSNTSAFLKDSRIAYSAQNEDIPPVANTGGLDVGWADAGEVFRTVNHYGSLSFPVDPANTGGLTYLHDVQDGSISVGADTDDDITVEYPVGERWHALTVEDDDNGATAVKYTWVRVHDRVSDPPLPCKSLERSSRVGEFPRARFSIPAHDRITLDALPEGALIVYWVDEWRGNAQTAVSYGSEVAGRSHIKFVGYLLSETITLNEDADTIEFEAISPLGVLQWFTSFSQVLKEVASPANWQQYAAGKLTVMQIIIYLLRWHTNLLELYDFIWSVSEDVLYPTISLNESTPFAQINEIATAISSQVRCDWRGRFEVGRNPQRASSLERAAIAKWFTALTNRDILPPLPVTWEHRYRVREVEVSGFFAGATPVPVKAVAPGEAPAEAPDRIQQERGIFSDTYAQPGANVVAGHAFAEANSLYDGKPVPRGIPLRLPAQYDVFDLYFQYLPITLSLPQRDARRTFSASKFLIKGITVAPDDDTGMQAVTLEVDHDTRGEPGTMRPVASPETTDFPPITYPPAPPTLPPTFPGAIPRGVQNMALICVSKLAWTGDFQTLSAAGGPTYTAATWASLGVSGTVLLWVADGFSPGEGWLFTTTKIYRLVLATGVATELHTWANTCYTVSADASFSQEGFVVAVAYVLGTGTIAARSTDGANFTETTISSAYATDANSLGIFCGCYVSSKTAGKVWTSVHTTTGSVTGGTVVTHGKESLDYGATWSDMTSPAIATDTTSLAQHIHAPWHNNPNDNIMYYSRHTFNVHRLYRVIGGSAVDISPVISGNKYDARTPRDVISTAFQNRRRVLFTGDRLGSPASWAVFLSNDAGDSWATIVADGTNYRHCALSGNDQNVGWVWGINNAIAQVAIAGNTASFESKTGNLAGLSIGEIIAIAGY